VLPDLRHCTVKFLQQILTKQKSVLIQETSKMKKCPHWPELSAKRLIPIVTQSAQLNSYLPEWTAGHREPDRNFVWTVICNVQPKYAKKLINEALRVRAKAQLEAKVPEQQ